MYMSGTINSLSIGVLLLVEGMSLIEGFVQCIVIMLGTGNGAFY